MKEALKDHMFIVEQALAAIKENGLDAYCSPIRGGTDGARLTFMGLPCPNLEQVVLIIMDLMNIVP